MTQSKEVQIEALKSAERQEPNKSNAKRIMTVRLLMEGYTIPQVMQIVNCSKKTVYNCQNRYASEGISGLSSKPKSGREKKLTPEQERKLYETIKTKLPNEVGFAPFVNWTSMLAVQWVKQNYDVTFSDRGMRNLFERIGLSYTRPTYTLKKADPEKQASFINEFEHIKKTDF
jgi:putative transposase